MKCRACDCDLSDSETRRKGLFSHEYIDLCDKCFETIADDVPLATGNESMDDELREDYGMTEVSKTDGTDEILH